MNQDMDDIFSVDEEDEFGGLDSDSTLVEESVSNGAVGSVGDEGHEDTRSTEDGRIDPVTGRDEAVRGLPDKSRTFTRLQKAVRLMLRRAGRSDLPSLDTLVTGKTGTMMHITDIGIFAGASKDPAVAELASECMVGNTLNFSAEITKNRVLHVGVEILRAGRMHMPIVVARITENNSYQCVSGRHRLAFFLLAYGSNIEIPVYVEDMTLEQARDAMGVANENRPAKAKERAELAVLQAMKGRSNVGQDELYARMATKKSNSRKYAVYSVVERGYPAKLSFPVSALRTGDGLTTLSNVETFLGAALEWTPETLRKEFDKSIDKAVQFLNGLVTCLTTHPLFDSNIHLTVKTMTALGKYHWNAVYAAKQNPLLSVKETAERLLGVEHQDLCSPDEILQQLSVAWNLK